MTDTAYRVFDAHVDSLQLALDLGRDLGEEGPGHLDLARGRRGGLSEVVLVCWADPSYIAPERGGARRRSEALLGSFHELLARHPDKLAFGGNGRLVEEARRAGRIAGIPGIEGGHSIEESLEVLERFFVRGVRVMTLVWNNHLTWIRSCREGAGPEVPAGLSDFGRDVVRTMNELGMVVDLSHAGERSFYDAIETSTKPCIASHSGCTAVNAHPRNLTDDQLRTLRDTGGVVGVVFCVPFLDAAAGAEDARLRETDGYRALAGDDTAANLAQGEFLQAHAEPLSIDRVCDHVLHAVEVAGVEHVGLGSDFDGIQRRPAGLESSATYPALAEALRARGMEDADLELVMGGNMRRVFAEATGEGTRAWSEGLGG